MGAGASAGPLTEKEEKFFAEMKHAYENEYKLHKTGDKIHDRDPVDFFKMKIDSFMESQAKDEEKKDDIGAKPEAKRIISRAPSCVESAPVYYVGDIVKAKVDGMLFEGVVIHYGEDDETLDVDFGDDIETVSIANCSLVMSGLDFEVGDFVQARTKDSPLYCHGKILKIHHDGTFDILFDGDSDDDVERGLPHEFVRKHKTGRDLAKKRWHRARAMLSTVRAFSHGNR